MKTEMNMVRTHTKISLINARGARCEVCKCSRWKGASIVTALVMARKDRVNPEYTDENAILVCRMCFYQHGYNRRRPFKRRTKAELRAIRYFNTSPNELAAMDQIQKETGINLVSDLVKVLEQGQK
jgi:hypothetical protein